MFYMTDLDDETQLVMEAEAGGAFNKNDLEVRPNPQKAFKNAVETAKTLAGHLATELRPTLNATGADAEITFAIKCDSAGMVLISQRTSEGQFLCKLLFKSGGTNSMPPAVLSDLPADDDPTDS